jgi:hypothetical protein
LACCCLPLNSTVVLTTQEATGGHPQQNAGYPPTVCMQPFFSCSSDGPYTRTDNFGVNPVPTGCGILTVTNGDGRDTDEVVSYEVFLDGERVAPAGHSRNAQVPVKVLAQIAQRRVHPAGNAIVAGRCAASGKGLVEHYNNVRLNSAIGYITPKDIRAGRQQEIHAERDRKLEEARKQRQIRRQQAA